MSGKQPESEVASRRDRRTAIVTGASAGIGAAIAKSLARLGWRVAIGARRRDRLEAVARELREEGGSAFSHPLDVSSAESVESFFDASEKEFGPADVVVSNAGLCIPGRLHELRPEDLRSEVATNLLGAMFVARRAIPPMLDAGGGGDLVFVSSDNARAPRPWQAAYSASKVGVEWLARALQMELEGTGIRSTIIRPGATQSEFGRSWPRDVIRKVLESWKHFGLQRDLAFLPAEAVARAVVVAVTTPRGVHLDTIQIQPEAKPVAARES